MKTMKNVPEVVNPYNYGYAICEDDLARIYHLVKLDRRNAKRRSVDSVLTANRNVSGCLTPVPADCDDIDHRVIICNTNQLDTSSYKAFAETLQKMLLVPTEGKFYNTDLIQTIAGVCSDFTNISDEADQSVKDYWAARCEQEFAMAVSTFGETAVAEAIDLLKPYAITKFARFVIEMTTARLHKQAA